MRAIKKWAEESIKPSNKQISALKGGRKSKSSSHKKLKNERQAVQASLQITTDERAVGRLLDIHEGTRKARTSPVCTQLIQGTMRS